MFPSWSLTAISLSPTASRPSCSAAPPSITLVTNIPLSPGMCWFPMPPAMLNPSPAREQTRCHAMKKHAEEKVIQEGVNQLSRFTHKGKLLSARLPSYLWECFVSTHHNTVVMQWTMKKDIITEVIQCKTYMS